MLAAAKSLLARPAGGNAAELCRKVRQATLADRGAYQRFTDSVFDEFLFGFQCTAVDFTKVMLLFRLPHLLGNSIAEDWCRDPGAYLNEYLREVLSGAGSEAARAKIRHTARLERDSGRKQIDEALQGTMANMQRHLVLAIHHFLSADILIKSLVSAGIPTAALPFSPKLAEEGFACTNTGIQIGAEFCKANPDAWALLAWRSTDLSPTKMVERQTSEIEPTFTHTFGEILPAQVNVQSSRLDQVKDGIRKLLAVEEQNQCRANFGFEKSWIAHSLLSGYRRLGDDVKAQQIAAQIAGELVVRAAFNR